MVSSRTPEHAVVIMVKPNPQALVIHAVPFYKICVIKALILLRGNVCRCHFGRWDIVRPINRSKDVLPWRHMFVSHEKRQSSFPVSFDQLDPWDLSLLVLDLAKSSTIMFLRRDGNPHSVGSADNRSGLRFRQSFFLFGKLVGLTIVCHLFFIQWRWSVDVIVTCLRGLLRRAQEISRFELLVLFFDRLNDIVLLGIVFSDPHGFCTGYSAGRGNYAMLKFG